MKVGNDKWPKIFSELNEEQKWIRDDFMKYLYTIFPKKFSFLERFNNNYIIKTRPATFTKTLEIGAGLGEHIFHEQLSDLQRQNYVALELRENMAEGIRNKHPDIQIWVGDCQEKIPAPDHEFDRIIASHVLEHLPNLPKAIKEIYRVCHKQQGVFSVVIPCEGGFGYSIGRKISVQRIFEKRYQQTYKWFIEREHVNVPQEILDEIQPYFKLVSREFFPLKFLPYTWCNISIGLNFKPKKLDEITDQPIYFD
ncbi:class I SAM-dependent methyltransferase [Rickettsiella endosymbiont of Xylota segnis]|uniref:class I SAM-dependent methyltransferase n=1 Tax=Rickettsiella endosymbiont of Xylota segnis TaxID=3066238 RepID=UPI0030D0A939